MGKQRTFAFLQSLPAPRDADCGVVAQCKGYGFAARISLESKPGGPWPQVWLARQLKVSKGYLCRVLRDQQPMPDWMLRPIAALTGSRLVLQYDEMQSGRRANTETETIHRLAMQVRAA